jgi:MarR family transcriptional regulator, transcriptional regulator for hemolysin
VQPFRTPIGLRLTQTARTVSRAFDEALEQAGGTLPVWLVLLNLKIHRPAHQRALAEAVGVRDATLTHHLNAMETRGLITRRRDPANRRIHVVELTAAGEEAFLRLHRAAIAFDARLNAGLSKTEVSVLSDLLGRLAANAGDIEDRTPPWAGLADGPATPSLSPASRSTPGETARKPQDEQRGHCPPPREQES